MAAPARPRNAGEALPDDPLTWDTDGSGRAVGLGETW